MTRPLEEVLAGVRCILLDFDGPVCSAFTGHSASDVADRIRTLAAAAGYQLNTASDDPFSVLKAAADISPALGSDVERLLSQLELESVAVATPTPGYYELISCANAFGIQVVIVSNNGTEAIRAWLTADGSIDFIHGIVGRDPSHIDRLKPDPYLVIKGTEISDATPAETVMIGDSITDIRAADSAGILSVGYANKPGKRIPFENSEASAVVDGMTSVARALGANRGVTLHRRPTKRSLGFKRKRRHPWQGRDWPWGVGLLVLAMVFTFGTYRVYSTSSGYPLAPEFNESSSKDISVYFSERIDSALVNVSSFDSYPASEAEAPPPPPQYSSRDTLPASLRFHEINLVIDRLTPKEDQFGMAISLSSRLFKRLVFADGFNTFNGGPMRITGPEDHLFFGETYAPGSWGEENVGEKFYLLASRGRVDPGRPFRYQVRIIVESTESFANKGGAYSSVASPNIGSLEKLGIDFEGSDPNNLLPDSEEWPAAKATRYRMDIAPTSSEVEVVRSDPPLRRDGLGYFWGPAASIHGKALIENERIREQNERKLYIAGLLGGLASGLWIELLLFVIPRRDLD